MPEINKGKEIECKDEQESPGENGSLCCKLKANTILHVNHNLQIFF